MPSSAHGGRAPGVPVLALVAPGCHPVPSVSLLAVCLSEVWWHLVAPSALAALCRGRGCSPTTARLGDTGVPLVCCHSPVLCPSGWVLWHVVGTARLGCGGTGTRTELVAAGVPVPSARLWPRVRRVPALGASLVCHIVACASVFLLGPQCQVPGLALPRHSVGLTLAATRALAVGGTGCAGYK